MLFSYHRKLTAHPIQMKDKNLFLGEVPEYGRKRGCPLRHHVKCLLIHWWGKISKNIRICWGSLSGGRTLGFPGGAVWVTGKLDHWNMETLSLSPITTILKGKLRLFKIKNQIYLKQLLKCFSIYLKTTCGCTWHAHMHKTLESTKVLQT